MPDFGEYVIPIGTLVTTRDPNVAEELALTLDARDDRQVGCLFSDDVGIVLGSGFLTSWSDPMHRGLSVWVLVMTGGRVGWCPCSSLREL